MLSADGDGIPVAVVLHKSHAVHLQVGIVEALSQLGDGPRFIFHANDQGFFCNGVPTGICVGLVRRGLIGLT